MKELECDVYRSPKQEYLYLFGPSSEGMDRVPQDLLTQFGEPEKTISFTLSADRELARENAALVMENLQLHGYHLQLPPADKKFV